MDLPDMFDHLQCDIKNVRDLENIGCGHLRINADRYRIDLFKLYKFLNEVFEVALVTMEETAKAGKHYHCFVGSYDIDLGNVNSNRKLRMKLKEYLDLTDAKGNGFCSISKARDNVSLLRYVLKGGKTLYNKGFCRKFVSENSNITKVSFTKELYNLEFVHVDQYLSDLIDLYCKYKKPFSAQMIANRVNMMWCLNDDGERKNMIKEKIYTFYF